MDLLLFYTVKITNFVAKLYFNYNAKTIKSYECYKHNQCSSRYRTI